jgi:hypothetical protein
MSLQSDLLSEDSRARPLRPASIQAYRYGLRQAVAGLHLSGTPLGSIAALSDVVRSGAPSKILQFYLDRNGKKPSKMVAQIAHVLVLVAEHAVRVDPETLARLKWYRKRLAPQATGLRARPQTGLRQFVDRVNIENLIALPQRIHSRLERQKRHTLADARLMQVAVALDIPWRTR